MTFQFPDKPQKGFYYFYKERGCEVKYIDGTAWVIIPFECPRLTDGGCRDYESRPGACRAFDGRKHPIAKEFCKIDSDE